MNNEELKAAICNADVAIKNYDDKNDPDYLDLVTLRDAARELLHLKDGTHPDMVMVSREPTHDFLDTKFYIKIHPTELGRFDVEVTGKYNYQICGKQLRTMYRQITRLS